MDEPLQLHGTGISRRRLLAGGAAASVVAVAAQLGDLGTSSAAAQAPSAGRFVERPENLRDIVNWTALELSAAIREKTVSCVEVMTAYLDQIDEFNPQVNAIVSLRPRAELLAEAAEKDRLLANGGEPQGWMHGFPQAVKDLANVEGMKTTMGFFPLDTVKPAAADSLFVERVRAAGAIFIGKTNTPEFGLGSNTYNNLFPTTFNAYDLTKSAGGSSGGAAVAVAMRMLPVADGSDFFGSLRNPPGWNNVYGMRPSFGRIPRIGEAFVAQGPVEGPIARTAMDLALLLETMAGYDPRYPMSIDDGLAGMNELRGDVEGAKVAWLGDIGGYLPMEPEVLKVTTQALEHFEALRMSVTTLGELPTHGSFGGTEDLWPMWLTFRHWLVGSLLAPLAANEALRAAMKPEALYEIEGLTKGANGSGPITGLDVSLMSAKRTAMYQAFQELFETYDYVALPTAQVFPFTVAGPGAMNWPEAIDGVEMSSYHRWMEVTSIATLLGAPAVAMPAGFSRSGMPIGIQVIGKNRDDAGVLRLAMAWDEQTSFVESRRPPLLDG